MRLSRIFVAAVIASTGFFFSATHARAECSGTCTEVTPGSTETVLIDGFRHEEAHAPPTRSRWWTGRRVVRQTFILDPRVLLGADGKPCVFIGQVEGEPGSIAEANAETTALRLLSQYPRC